MLKTKSFKKNRKRFNKRGAEDMLVDFWTILIFALIVIIFFILFSISKSSAENTAGAEFDSKDAQFMLDSFLGAPLVDNPSKTVSDVIIEDSTTGDFTRTEKLFEEYFKRSTKINDEPVNDILITIDGAHDDTYRITTENGNGQFVKATKVVFEDVKAFFVTLVSDEGWSVYKKLAHYNAETYLPGYEKRVHVKIAVVTWTYGVFSFIIPV
jgi:hypothetical protein